MSQETPRSIFGTWTGLTEFAYHWTASDPRNSYIDLVLTSQEGRRRRFRFVNPQAVKIPEGGLSTSGEFVISDVRTRQMEVKVQVSSYSDYADGYLDSPTFWAERVVEISDDENSGN
jgi:hypothetical protein